MHHVTDETGGPEEEPDHHEVHGDDPAMNHNPFNLTDPLMKEEPDMDSSYGSNTVHQTEVPDRPKAGNELSVANINFELKEEPDVSTVSCGSSADEQDLVERTDKNESSQAYIWILNSSGTTYVQKNRDDMNDELGSVMDSTSSDTENTSDCVKQDNDPDVVVVKTVLADDSSKLQQDTADEKDKTSVEHRKECTEGQLEVDQEQILIKTETDDESNLMNKKSTHAPMTTKPCSSRARAEALLFKPFECRVCGELFSAKVTLYAHSFLHEDDKPFVCGECGMSFSADKTLERHMKTHHGRNSSTSGNCGECGMSFSADKHLKRHMKTHHGGNSPTSENCGNSKSLKRAACKRTRTYKKPVETVKQTFLCAMCGKTFSTEIGIRGHIRTHTGEKPYECSECGKTFAHRGNFTYHKRLHSGEKPYACKVCGKRFSHTSDVSRHERTHTGEKPFSCKVCGKTFTQKSSLNSHKLKH